MDTDSNNKMDGIKDELELMKNSIRMETQISKVFESINDIANKTNIHETRIAGLEKDVVVLNKGQEQLKQSTDRLHSKIDDLDKSHSILGVVVNNTHQKVADFIDQHKEDAPKAIKTMKNLIWSGILVALATFSSIGGFMAWQSSIIISSEREKTKLIKEMYEMRDEYKK